MTEDSKFFLEEKFGKEPKERKIVGIATVGNALGMRIVVLCDDGTLWEEYERDDFHKGRSRAWRRYYASIPRIGEEESPYR